MIFQKSFVLIIFVGCFKQKDMKNTYKILTYIIVAATLAGCAKISSEGVNIANKRYLDAWIQLTYPNAKATWNGAADENGIYTIESEEGTGVQVKKDGYAIVTYTATDLEGNITSYTDKETAKQLLVYDTTTYYGPQVWMTKNETIQAGLQDAIVGMKVGGKKKVVVPSWLMTYSSYSTAKQYLNKSSDYSNAIYEICVEDFAEDIDKWQIHKMEGYMTENYGGADTFTSDTTGFYYKRLSQPTGTADKFKSDTTFYINYTGKLLNGLTFDTTIEKIAKDNGLYKGSKKYEPVKITWGEKHSDITMEGSSVVSGFSLALWNLRNLGKGDIMDKGVAVFYSPLGYGYSGSGASIPGYAPLVFEIEVVPAPEE